MNENCVKDEITALSLSRRFLLARVVFEEEKKMASERAVNRSSVTRNPALRPDLNFFLKKISSFLSTWRRIGSKPLGNEVHERAAQEIKSRSLLAVNLTCVCLVEINSLPVRKRGDYHQNIKEREHQVSTFQI